MNLYSKNLKTTLLFIKTGLLAGFLFLLQLSGCKEAIPTPKIHFTENPSEKVIATPEIINASHGQKGQITISWTSVKNAKRYNIYKADTPYSKYEQIAEADGASTNKAIKVPAGYSAYFKVAAVNAAEEQSDLTIAAYGTSLASPVITAITNEETSTTVYWYMENLSIKSYLSKVQFMVNCYDNIGNIKETKLISNTEDTFCTFDNLNSGIEYSFQVESYILDNQNDVEKSLKLNSKTLVSTTPKIASFSATEGTDASKIILNITLPQIGKILKKSSSNGSTGQDEYEDKPLFFTIQRYDEIISDFVTVVPYLAFNGTTTQITSDQGKTYTEGDHIQWSDTSIERGVKYTYRVLSFIDDYFENPTKRFYITHSPDKANKSTGWAAAIPAISTSELIYSTDEDENGNPYKSSATCTINTSWNSFEKEEDYVFLLLQNRRLLKSDNGGFEDSAGTNSFIRGPLSYYFSSISQLNSFPLSFQLLPKENDQTNINVRGYYSYSICILPKAESLRYADPNTNVNEILNSLLTIKQDASTKLITDGNIPEPQIEVKDGFLNKNEITFTAEADTTYNLIRQTINSNDEITETSDPIPLIVKSGNNYINATGVTDKQGSSDVKLFTDSNLESGKGYRYTVYASNSSLSDIPSSTKSGFTLGTPTLIFDHEKLDYNTITVRWNSVQHESEKREIESGIRNSSHDIKYTIIHNGKSYVFSQSEIDFKCDSTESKVYTESTDAYELLCNNSKEFILKIKKDLENFNYTGTKPSISCLNAGTDIDVIIKATNDITQNISSNFTESSTYASILGPAKTNIFTSKAESVTTITVKWNKIPGVTLYAVRRICPAMNEDDTEKTDILYVTDSGLVSTSSGTVSESRTVATVTSSQIILTDQQCTADNPQNSYETNQEKIQFGLEYAYTVFPVKSKGENPFEDFDINYTDDKNPLITQTGYTPGYGINVKASKADYPDRIRLSWDKPNSYAGFYPTIWFRQEETDTWKKPSKQQEGTTDTIVYLPKELRNKKVEFFITYESTEDIVFAETYFTYLKNKKDSDNEPYNVGYEFTISSFDAVKPVFGNETFEETLTWTAQTDLNEPRKKRVGDGITGDCYELYILNKNCSADWIKIATLAKDGNISPIEQPWFDAEFIPIAKSGLKILAKNSGAAFEKTKRLTRDGSQIDGIKGVHDGILKVQRDYKHYYKLVAKRKNSYDDIIETSLGNFTDTTSADEGSQTEIYTYRKISDDEFVKGITLIVADAIWQAGINTGGTREVSGLDITDSNGNQINGKFHLEHPGGTTKIKWGTSGKDYIHIFSGGTPGNDNISLASGWRIRMDNKEGSSCATYSYLAKLPWNMIVVSHETGLASYQGYIFLTCGDGSDFDVLKTYVKNQKWNLSIQYSHLQTEPDNSQKIIITSRSDTTFNSNYDNNYTVQNNQAEFYKWLPYEFGESHKSSETEFDSSLPQYQNTWWEVR